MSFRVGEGAVVALVGPHGTGKTTLMRIIAGDLSPHGGSVNRSGGLGVMRQFIGSVRDDSTSRDLLVSVLDEPSDNLDLHSAEALEESLAGLEATVLAVPTTGGSPAGFDRFLVFGAAGPSTRRTSRSGTRRGCGAAAEG